jgi:hypothetical protein
MAELDPRARGISKLYLSRFGVKARQLVFDRLQRFEHLAGQEKFGPLLRLGIVNIPPLPFHL